MSAAPLKIAFIDPIDWDYVIDTPYEEPLGGTQSAVCYLSECLAALGHEVFLFNRTSRPGVYRGVVCEHLDHLPRLAGCHVVVSVNAPHARLHGQLLAAAGEPRPRLLLWLHHDVDQPAVAPLQDPRTVALWDGFALVSDWQARRFVIQFGLPPSRLFIARNGVGPAFLDLYKPGEEILASKPDHPVLCYASTPFRGLDVLLMAFPLIQRAFPAARLKVFSSLKVYRASDDPYQDLYDLCRQMAGVDYVGSLSQVHLAQAMKEATCLAYPSTFAETSCITVMEGFAAGCRVVTNDLGALPETTAGLAILGPRPDDPGEHARVFALRVIHALQRVRRDPAGEEVVLQAGVAGIRGRCAWRARAVEWLGWLEGGAAAQGFPA